MKPISRPHWWRLLRAVLAGVLALALAAAGGLWLWAGSEGSLATAIAWAAQRLPLAAEGVTGTLRAGGTAQRLTWRQGGLRVEIEQAELRWRPAALLARTLQIEQLSARRVVVDDQQPAGQGASGPPEPPALPLHLRIAAWRVGELHWVGPPPFDAHDVAGRFAFDGATHRLELDRARVAGGSWRLRAALSAHAPLRIDLALAGALAAPVPGGDAPLPFTLQATLRGPITEMQAQASLLAAPPAPGAPTPAMPALPPLAGLAAIARTGGPATTPGAGVGPQPADDQAAVQLDARITPWAGQPLPEVHARLQALDLRALWAQAPHTRLSGALDLAPLPGTDTPGWAVTADLANANAGPWDHHSLPVAEALADLTWRDGTATVRTLKARVAGGTVESTGQWSRPGRTPATGSWRIDTRVSGIDPGQLHTALAPWPVDGTAQLEGTGASIDFALEVRARSERGAAPAEPTPAERVADDLRALRLRGASARGRWDGGQLALERLRVTTDDAELAGSASLHTAESDPADVLGGRADLRFTAPGIQAQANGELYARRGGGTVRADLANAARALAWLNSVPGGAAVVAGAQARGRATIQARWSGGWRDPAVQAALTVPNLDWHAPGDAPPQQWRDGQIELDGRLAQARLSAQGRVSQGARRLELMLTASGGRATSPAGAAPSPWRLSVARWQAGASDPALGPGTWRLSNRGPVTLAWSPAQGGRLDVGAGELTITAPAPAPGQPVLVAWGPQAWHGGELTTSGRIAGVPLQWAQRIAGTRWPDATPSGDVLFDGTWDAALGRELRLNARLARASGDLSLIAIDPDTGVRTRVAAGLRRASLELTGAGPALQLRLGWDSEHAGQIDGVVHTELAAARDGAGPVRWSWPESAPLRGELKARLPRIDAWAVLAPPGWRLRGTLALDARVDGTRAAPTLVGTLAADDLALRSVVDGIQLQGGRLRAHLADTRLVIDEFSLRGAGAGSEGGRLQASGEAGWINGRAQARLTATLERLHASVRPDRDVTVSGQVSATLAARTLQVDGRLHVDQARIALPDDSRPQLGDDVVVHGADGAARARQQASGTPATSAASDPAGAIGARVNVQIDLGNDFRVRGMGIDTLLAGTLALTAGGPPGTPPHLTGEVQTRGGRFHAYSQNLDITRGRITFTGPPDNPRLDIIALRPNFASDQKVGVQVAGSALLPRVNLYADPGLPDNQILAWLLLGRPAPATGAEAAMLQSAALALLGGRQGRGLAARLGLDELSFANGGSAGKDGVAGASVTLGKRLSDRLYAAYEHSLAGASGTLLIFYELSRRWSLRGQAGADSAVDLIFNLSFD